MNESVPTTKRPDGPSSKDLTRKLIIDGLRQMEAAKQKLKDALDSLQLA